MAEQAEIVMEPDSVDIVVALPADFDELRLSHIPEGVGPAFKVSEVGELFFHRTSFWVRWLEKRDKNVLGGNRVDCPHGEMVDKISDDGKKTIKTRVSWVSDDGICTRCNGQRVMTSKTEKGYRIYYLPDIERLVHAYLENGAISASQAINANVLAQTLAKIHELIS